MPDCNNPHPNESPQVVKAPHPSRCRDPAYLNKEAFEYFKTLPIEDTDVVMCSYPKCGTSQMNSILLALLKMDQYGQLTVPETSVGMRQQVYPDAVALTRSADVVPEVERLMKDWCIDDLVGQTTPRLFTGNNRYMSPHKCLLFSTHTLTASTCAAIVLTVHKAHCMCPTYTSPY